MRWCNLQTNEHDLQAIMYPIVCKYHRLNINRLNTNNWNKVPVFPRYICNRWQNMVVQPSQTHNHGKIWQQWERWILSSLESHYVRHWYFICDNWISVSQCVFRTCRNQKSQGTGMRSRTFIKSGIYIYMYSKRFYSNTQFLLVPRWNVNITFSCKKILLLLNRSVLWIPNLCLIFIFI